MTVTETIEPTPGHWLSGGWVSSNEACRAAGLTYRQLDYWARIGIIEPDVPAEGCGTVRRFRPAQVPILRVLGQLAVAGAGADQLRGAWKHLSALPASKWSGKLFVTPGGFVASRMTGPVALVVNLERTRGEALAAQALNDAGTAA